MKKILKYTLAIIVVLSMMLAITGCGNKDKDKKEYSKENETIEKQEENNVTDEKNSTENKDNEENQTKNEKNESNITKNNTTKSIKAFSNEDLTINGFKLGESAKAVEAIYDEIPETKTYKQDATGTTITELDYKSVGLKVYNEFEDIENLEDGEGNDGEMTSIEIYGTSKLQTARGIKIGSSKEEVLKAYPSNSILKSDSVDENTIIVGYPGSEPVYGSKNGNIYYFIKNGKVSRILLAYAIAE